jgi:hypothetical protein
MQTCSTGFGKTLDLNAAQGLHARMLLLDSSLERNMARHVVLFDVLGPVRNMYITSVLFERRMLFEDGKNGA